MSDKKGAELLIQFSKDKGDSTVKRVNGNINCQMRMNQRQQCSTKEENKENVPINAKSSPETRRVCHILRCKPRVDKALSSICKKEANETPTPTFKKPVLEIDSLPVARGDITISKCTFQCPYCVVKSDRFRWFQMHMKQEHNKFAQVSAALCYLSKGTVYRCRVCSEKILCEPTILSFHMQAMHRLSFDDYRWQHCPSVVPRKVPPGKKRGPSS